MAGSNIVIKEKAMMGDGGVLRTPMGVGRKSMDLGIAFMKYRYWRLSLNKRDWSSRSERRSTAAVAFEASRVMFDLRCLISRETNLRSRCAPSACVCWQAMLQDCESTGKAVGAGMSPNSACSAARSSADDSVAARKPTCRRQGVWTASLPISVES